MSTPHGFGCAGDGACSCGCSAEPPAQRSVGAMPGGDPLSVLLDTGADMLPLPGPLQNVARDAARAGVTSFAHEVEAARGAAQQAADMGRQAAAQAAAAARPRIRIQVPPKKKGLSRGAKVGLGVAGATLVGLGVAAKVLL